MLSLPGFLQFILIWKNYCFLTSLLSNQSTYVAQCAEKNAKSCWLVLHKFMVPVSGESLILSYFPRSSIFLGGISFSYLLTSYPQSFCSADGFAPHLTEKIDTKPNLPQLLFYLPTSIFIFIKLVLFSIFPCIYLFDYLSLCLFKNMAPIVSMWYFLNIVHHCHKKKNHIVISTFAIIYFIPLSLPEKVYLLFNCGKLLERTLYA